MHYNYDRSFKFKINSDSWECYLVTDEELKELDAQEGNDLEDHLDDDDNDDAPAMILTQKKCLLICEGCIRKDIVAHELFHIMVEYFYTGSANLTVDQFEEVVANFLEQRLDYFVRTRNSLYKRFKRLEGET
jgi:hypothetical protein